MAELIYCKMFFISTLNNVSAFFSVSFRGDDGGICAKMAWALLH
jgi:hypothetical protein